MQRYRRQINLLKPAQEVIHTPNVCTAESGDTYGGYTANQDDQIVGQKRKIDSSFHKAKQTGPECRCNVYGNRQYICLPTVVVIEQFGHCFVQYDRISICRCVVCGFIAGWVWPGLGTRLPGLAW